MYKDYDQLLDVKTTNRRVSTNQPLYYNHYEATPYPILYALFQKYEIKETDGFVDFGSGKGRVLFYIHNHFGASVTGIEMNEQLYQKTIENKVKYYQHANSVHSPIHVKKCLAEEYDIKDTDNKFYFFNPFSVQIFREVVENILHSVEKKAREVDIILYYPSNEYIHFIKKNTPFQLAKEIRVPGLYTINNRERFLIYRLHKLGNP